MKLSKKILSLLIVFVLVFTSFSTFDSMSVEASAKVKVRNGSKKSLIVGDSAAIVINLSKSSVKFTTSDKKVASVSSKGIIKAVAAGTAKITVKSKADGSKATVTVNVAPKKVKNVTATDVSATSAKVSWTPVKSVTGYKIYAAKSVNGSYKLVKTVKGATKKYATVTGLASQNTYYFKVKAYRTMKGKTFTSEFSSHNKDVYKYALKQYKNSVELYKLVWSDEFNGSSLNTSVWKFETGNGQGGWGNEEYEFYTAGQNLKFENGCFVLIPRIEKNNSTGSMDCTSTRVITRNTKSFKYGKIEIRAKASGAHGTWSAGWMLGLNGKIWPANGEIDIFESMKGSVPQTIHCPYFNNQSTAKGGNKNFNTGLTQAQSSSAFHTYGIVWTDKYIQFTVDGRVVDTYYPAKYNPSQFPLSQTWECFKNPFYFILNCAIGGNAALEKVNGQYVPINLDTWKNVGTKNGITTYEDYCYIDYVRVYQCK